MMMILELLDLESRAHNGRRGNVVMNFVVATFLFSSSAFVSLVAYHYYILKNSLFYSFALYTQIGPLYLKFFFIHNIQIRDWEHPIGRAILLLQREAMSRLSKTLLFHYY